MRSVHVRLDEDLDQAAAVEVARRGVSKAALIRASLARELAVAGADATAAWASMTGWLADGGLTDVDDTVYGSRRPSAVR